MKTYQIKDLLKNEVLIIELTIIDDATHDNSLYFEMCEADKLELLEQEQAAKQAELDYKKDYINGLFDNE